MPFEYLDEEPKKSKFEYFDEEVAIRPSSMVGMPGYSRVEQKITARDFRPQQEQLAQQIAASYSQMFKRGSAVMPHQDPRLVGQTLGLVNQRIEPMFANPALAMQSGGGAGQAFNDFTKGLTGERMGQFGDVYRRLNVPEPVSAALGVGNMATIYGAGSKLVRWMQQNPVFKFGKNAVLDVAEKADKGLNTVYEKVSNKYESGLKSIKGTTKSVDKIIAAIDEVEATYPEEKISLFNKIKTRLSENFNLSAEELHNLKMELKKGIPKSVFKGSADPTPLQAARLRVYNSVDDTLVELGGKKYLQMKAEYTKFMKMANDVNKVILEEGRPGDVKLRNWWGQGLSRRQNIALSELNKQLPKEQQFLQGYNAWRRGKILESGAGASTAAYVFHRWLTDKLLKNR